MLECFSVAYYVDNDHYSPHCVVYYILIKKVYIIYLNILINQITKLIFETFHFVLNQAQNISLDKNHWTLPP